MKYKCRVCAIFLYLLSLTSAKCNLPVLSSLEYIVEHAVWRGWHQAILYTTNLESDCQWATLRLVKCLGVNGIASAVNIKKEARLNTFLGIVIFYRPVKTNATNKFITTINQITDFKMNTASYDWLIIAASYEDFKNISDSLNATNVRFDQNIIISLPESRVHKVQSQTFCQHNFNCKRYKMKKWQHLDKNYQPNPCFFHKNNICNRTEYEVHYYRSSERLKNITSYKRYRRYDGRNNRTDLPLWMSSFLSYNTSRNFRAVNANLFQQEIKKYSQNSIITTDNVLNKIVIQVFKMRLNSTLFIAFLGIWSQGQSMSLVDPPYPVEARNLMGESFVIGKCNCSTEGFIKSNEDNSAPDLLDNVSDFLALRLNTTFQSKYYGKLGYRTYEGAWTGLLGAVMDQTVDIALEPVTAMPLHQTDFDLIFPISKTMYNIYIRHQETSAVRDIFLAPFSPQLIACVVCVVMIVATTMIIISKMTFHFESRRMSCTDAVIWSMGILCQQGSSWIPCSPAAGVLLIAYLLFALVTYNAYAAFITSVLSVRVANVGSLGDVLQSSHIKIGYVRNGADQMYLMSTKDVQLNAFYIRGYSEAENLVSSAEEGLIRAAMQDYAFFSGQRAARTTIKSLSQARGRCALRELPVLSTRAQLAFPLPRGSPYAKPVLISLLQLRSSGILSRLEDALVPSMPRCKPSTGFASARAADVMTALFVILTGYIAALFIGIAEITWNKRREWKRYFRAHLRYESH